MRDKYIKKFYSKSKKVFIVIDNSSFYEVKKTFKSFKSFAKYLNNDLSYANLCTAMKKWDT